MKLPHELTPWLVANAYIPMFPVDIINSYKTLLRDPQVTEKQIEAWTTRLNQLRALSKRISPRDSKANRLKTNEAFCLETIQRINLIPGRRASIKYSNDYGTVKCMVVTNHPGASDG